MKVSLLSWFAVILSAVTLVACEGKFVGEREENAEVINGPSQLKIETIEGAPYLIVLNTNYRFQKAQGSIQFYSLANPSIPTKATNIQSLTVPSNVSDFAIVDGAPPRLYLLNRNRDEMWIYELGAGTFNRFKLSGNDLVVPTGANPMRLVKMNSSLVGGREVLAVIAQRSGAIALFDPQSLTYVEPPARDDPPVDYIRLSRGNIPAAGFYMRPRRTWRADEDDRLGRGSIRSSGFGITGGVFLNSATDLFVGYNVFDNVIYGYQFATFENTANFTWDLPDFREDRELSPGVVRQGTGESGIRGIAKDDANNIYFSSRQDNSVYMMPFSELNMGRVTDNHAAFRNTRGHHENAQDWRLNVQFDSDLTDEVFPRLGDLTANQTGTQATTLWVLGLGEGVVGKEGSLYRVDVTTSTLTAQRKLGLFPQRIAYYKDGANNEHIYVSNAKSDTVLSVDPTTLETLATIQDP